MHDLRWHKLSSIIVDGTVQELMAATCCDGIGIIARWVWQPKEGCYRVTAMDTELQEWEVVTAFGDEECIPARPPFDFDDRPDMMGAKFAPPRVEFKVRQHGETHLGGFAQFEYWAYFNCPVWHQADKTAGHFKAGELNKLRFIAYQLAYTLQELRYEALRKAELSTSTKIIIPHEPER